MFRQIKEKIQNVPLLVKIYLILFLVILPVIFTSQLGLQKVSDVYRELLYQNVAAQLSNSGHEISNKFHVIENISQLIMADDIVQSDLYTLSITEDDQVRSDMNKELRRILGEYRDNFREVDITYIDLYSDSFSASTNSYESRKTPDAIRNEILDITAKEDGRSVWIGDYSGDHGLYLGKEIRQIRGLSLSPLGELLIHVDIDKMIRKATVFSNQYDTSAYLLMDGNTILYHSPQFTEEQGKAIHDQVNDSYAILNIDGHSYFAVKNSLPDYSWDYICLIAFDKLQHTILQTIRTSMLTILICFSIMIILASLMIRSLVRHLSILKDKMLLAERDISLVPEASGIYQNRKDEIGILHQQFDNTVSRLKNLIQVNYVNELLKKEAQLKALESQINPHFLYNTLESINWRAKALGAGDISEMVQSLGALLRVTLKKRPTEFTLYQEMDLVKHYMTIQQYRFEDRLQYSIDIPESLYPAIIPRLTLQPLVENAIHYGLEDNIDDCEICITAFESGQKLHVLVRNTGSYIEEDLLQKLEAETVIPHGWGIGLLNIHKRLRLTFGEEAGLYLYNQGDRAVAEVIIPWNRGDQSC